MFVTSFCGGTNTTRSVLFKGVCVHVVQTGRKYSQSMQVFLATETMGTRVVWSGFRLYFCRPPRTRSRRTPESHKHPLHICTHKTHKHPLGTLTPYTYKHPLCKLHLKPNTHWAYSPRNPSVTHTHTHTPVSYTHLTLPTNHRV